MQAYNSQIFGFGDRFRTARKAAGLDRATLAAKLGLQYPSQISRYETGKSFPTVPTLFTLTNLLSVDLHWLITGETCPAATREAEKYRDAIDELRILAYYFVQGIVHQQYDLLAKKDAIVDRLAKTGDKALVDELQKIERRLSELKAAHDDRVNRVNGILKTLGYPDTI